MRSEAAAAPGERRMLSGWSGRPIAGRRVWVIGASSGIGAALARELVTRGAQVAISARRLDRLEAESRGDMVCAPADVTDLPGLRRAARTVNAALGPVDTAIVAAGYWKRADARDWDTEEFARHVEVNLLGLSNCIAVTLPDMLRRGSGHLLGVSSVSGYRGIPGAEYYGATKAAATNLLEGLRAAVAGLGVHVTTISPGFVRTPMTDVNDFPMPFLIEADEAARIVADGMERGRNEIVFPLPMAVAMKAARVLPNGLWAQIAPRGAARGPRRRASDEDGSQT